MKNKHLTAAQRRAIEVLLQRNCTLKEIARILGVSSSTVSREIKKYEGRDDLYVSPETIYQTSGFMGILGLKKKSFTNT